MFSTEPFTVISDYCRREPSFCKQVPELSLVFGKWLSVLVYSMECEGPIDWLEISQFHIFVLKIWGVFLTNDMKWSNVEILNWSVFPFHC